MLIIRVGNSKLDFFIFIFYFIFISILFLFLGLELGFSMKSHMTITRSCVIKEYKMIQNDNIILYQ